MAEEHLKAHIAQQVRKALESARGGQSKSGIVRRCCGAADDEAQLGTEAVTKACIALELHKALSKLGARSDLLRIVGSYGNALPDEEVLRMLERWNVLHREESLSHRDNR